MRPRYARRRPQVAAPDATASARPPGGRGTSGPCSVPGRSASRTRRSSSTRVPVPVPRSATARPARSADAEARRVARRDDDALLAAPEVDEHRARRSSTARRTARCSPRRDGAGAASRRGRGPATARSARRSCRARRPGPRPGRGEQGRAAGRRCRRGAGAAACERAPGVNRAVGRDARPRRRGSTTPSRASSA